MERQAEMIEQTHFPSSVLHRLQSAYRQLEQAANGQPWVVQGSVNVVAPRSPGGKVTYTWTRKVRAKTATVALSETQAQAFLAAIEANRRLEEAFTHLREVSQTALLDSLPGVSRRRSDLPRKRLIKTVHNGA